jgi:pyridoxal phosphate enzyme (YggS family)
VNFDGTTLRDRLEAIRLRISNAAVRSGRGPEAVALIGVTKTVAASVVAEVVGLGLADLGENRVQEAQEKIASVGRASARWHLIGHLQRNKAARAVELFDRVHGVDDFAIAAALSKRAETAGRRLPALIEVNVSGEATKFGVAPDDAEALLERVLALPGLMVDGLMTVGAPVERAADARPGFSRLRELRDRLGARLGVALPVLSMGMSDDFEVAIEEGSTMVRVGTALFGARS